MFARIVTFPLKDGAKSEYTKVLDKTVIPLLRKHKGFTDQIGLVSDDGKTCYGISFWDSKANFEAYDRSGFDDIKKSLDAVAAGPITKFPPCEVATSTVHKVTLAA